MAAEILAVPFTPSPQDIELKSFLVEDMKVETEVRHDFDLHLATGPYRLVIQVGLHGREGTNPTQGLVFLRMLVGRFAPTPVLVITGHQRKNILGPVLQCGGSEVLHRPYHPAELVLFVRKILERRPVA